MKTAKAIVIGLDGFEPKLVESMLAAGVLPNLARLRAAGGYACLRTTYPALTPVAWSTFATGTNPGGHGIFDFIRRHPETYLPDFFLTRYEQKKPYLPPKVVNLRRGTPVWKVLAQASLPATVLRCPCTYPPDAIRGRMLSGMGVPDVRGGLGTSTFYCSDAHVHPQESEKVVHVRIDSRRTIDTYLLGPRNPKAGGDFTCDLSLTLEPSAKKVVVRSDGEPRVLEVHDGQ